MDFRFLFVFSRNTAKVTLSPSPQLLQDAAWMPVQPCLVLI